MTLLGFFLSWGFVSLLFFFWLWDIGAACAAGFFAFMAGRCLFVAWASKKTNDRDKVLPLTLAGLLALFVTFAVVMLSTGRL